MLPGVSTSGDSAPTSTSPPPQQTSAAATPAVAAATDLSDDGGGGGGRNSGGNRWPRQETLYLLKIRSDMDAAFRDSSLKGPLWDEVSRKLAALGFNRSAKKCKEKFENVYKYHKRIKEGRSSKADGKTYKFFEQLQALEGSTSVGGGGNHQPPLALPPPPTAVIVSKPPMPSVVTPIGGVSELQQNNVDPISVAAPAVGVAMPAAMNMDVNQAGGFRFSQLNMSALDMNSSSGSGSSDDEAVEKRRNRKRKWKEFFGKLMKEVVEKQEELQSKFLDALERRERDRMAREEAWRVQEMAKMKREHELLVQERSMVAAKDAAVITFLQKITEQNPNSVIPQMSAMQLLQQQQQQQQQQLQPTPTPTPPPPQPTPPMQQQPQPQQQPEPQQHTPPALPAPVSAPISVPIPARVPPPPAVKSLEIATGENILQPSPSRWPKAEINALIQIRTSLDTKYQENGPKGPLWEEVSAAMRNLGYNRNAKRCKEKWENINKYYKKVKESSKKRPEDSKTCPYFHQLDAIYREKASASGSNSNNNSNSNPGLSIKPESQMAPIMARPEQQWPLPAVVQQQQQQQQQQQYQQKQQQQQENADLNEDDYDDEDEDDEEDEEGGEYEIVPNKTSSMASTE